MPKGHKIKGKRKVKKDRITPKTVDDDIKYIISEHKNKKTIEQLLMGSDKDLTEHQKYVISEMKKGNPLQNTSIYLCFYNYQPTSSSGSGGSGMGTKKWSYSKISFRLQWALPLYLSKMDHPFNTKKEYVRAIKRIAEKRKRGGDYAPPGPSVNVKKLHNIVYRNIDSTYLIPV